MSTLITPSFSVANLGDTWLKGSYLQGHFTADRATLVGLFGNPHVDNGTGGDKEWALEFHDGTRLVRATIYPAVTDSYGRSISPGQWHIGGYDRDALYVVQEFLLRYGV